MAHDKVSEEFGSLLFTDADMQDRLPKPTYKKLKRVIDDGAPLDIDIANEVAHAMKEWALEKGATHFTHWFQPLNGITSEKHDSFITPKGDGTVLMAFSGKELVQGETDASSFPSGGMRATFEARGYTVWDPVSPVFIKDEVLCIPTAFISYTGDALDKKTPLLRSEVALETQAKRVLALFGQTPSRVVTTCGPEQEYFLIKEEDYQARPDLILCGRTLFGAAPSKGQELEEHYFGAIRPTVNEFMKELDDELWKLGVPAKTKHNEVAPCQHELAPIFEQGSVAVDDNLLTMEKMKLTAPPPRARLPAAREALRVRERLGQAQQLVALCRRKEPPRARPRSRAQPAVPRVPRLPDRRRRRARRPPARVRRLRRQRPSPRRQRGAARHRVGLSGRCPHPGRRGPHPQGARRDSGRELMDLGVPTLPDVIRDNTDRNRTSPFAFTGNKFEFRMPGSQQNLSDPNVVINTAVAEQCERFVDYVSERSDQDFQTVAMRFVRHTFRDHQRVIFNGNGYSEDWPVEAERRGLLNLRTTPDAIPALISPENVALFERYGILGEAELHARYVAKCEQYEKLLNIEANTMSHMVHHLYLPALSQFSGDIAASVATKAEIGIVGTTEKELVRTLTEGIEAIYEAVAKLEAANAVAQGKENPQAQCNEYRDVVIPLMEELRTKVDAMEVICGDEWWPVPTYNKMLFYV